MIYVCAFSEALVGRDDDTTTTFNRQAKALCINSDDGVICGLCERSMKECGNEYDRADEVIELVLSASWQEIS